MLFYSQNTSEAKRVGVEVPSQIWKFSEMNIPTAILKTLKLKVISFYVSLSLVLSYPMLLGNLSPNPNSDAGYPCYIKWTGFDRSRCD